MILFISLEYNVSRPMCTAKRENDPNPCDQNECDCDTV